MATTPPALGYGQRDGAPIDAVNQWLRSRPEYQQYLSSIGQSPNNVHLSETQQQDVVRLAQKLGVVVDEGHDGQEVDESGNFRPKGHGLRNTLIVAGIAGAALATWGISTLATGAAAGASAGAGGGAAAATGGGAAAAAGGAAAAAGAGAASAVPWGAIVGAGTQLFGNLFAAHEAASGADQAAQIAAAANKYTADLQAKATADALAFQEGNAENSFLNSEAARKGNYGIFAARERRLGSIGDEVGLGPREIPNYVPGVDPGWGNGAASTGGGQPSAPAGGGNPADPGGIMSMLTDNYKKLGKSPTGPGSGPTDIAYMAQRVKETGGLTPDNVKYWFGPQGRIAAEIAKAGGGGASSAQPPAGPGVGQPGGPAPQVAATPFMTAYTPPTVPQSVGYYMGT